MTRMVVDAQRPAVPSVRALPVRRTGALPVWLAGLVAIAFSREYAGPDGPAHSVYSAIPAGFGLRFIDAAILVVAYLMAVRSLLVPSPRWTVSRSMRWALLAFAVATAISVSVGFIRGGTQLFYEWRNVVLGLCVAYVTRNVLVTVNAAKAARWLFLLLSGRATFLLALWLVRGRSESPLGGPVWDGPTLSSAVAAVALGSVLMRRRGKGVGPGIGQVIAYGALTLGSATLVVTALRRTYWVELTVVVLTLLLLSTRVRAQVVAGALLTLVMLGRLVPADTLGLRWRSLVAPLDTTNPLAATNVDHINDVIDALAVVRDSPVWGLGQGLPYGTNLIARWKRESWGVHNGPIHVWLRFGLLGLLAYLWFHWAAGRWLLKGGGRDAGPQLPRAVFAYWAGTFVPSLGLSPWPYGALQNAALIGALAALADAWIASRNTEKMVVGGSARRLRAEGVT